MRVVADVGGTTSRFARVGPAGTLEALQRYATAGFDGLAPMLERYLQDLPPCPLAELVLAVAGPVDDGESVLTNVPWRVSAAVLAARLGARVQVVNDVVAVAMLLPHLQPGDHAPLRDTRATQRAPRIAINVGTGFGAACVVPVDGRWVPLASEAGHMCLGVMSETERAAFEHVRRVEDLLCGAGLADLREALGEDEAVRRFSAVLGRVCGDLVLATGAWGGAFLCGGVIQALADQLDVARFLSAFDDKGPMAARMAAVPVSRLRVPEPALRGLAMGFRD